MKTFDDFLFEGDLFSNEIGEDEMRKNLFEKISSLGKWLYTSNGLGMMTIIDNALNKYSTPISAEEVSKFNLGLSILNRTTMSPKISEKLKKKAPNGPEKLSLVRDNSGNWSYVNKLNTNYSDLAELLTELIIRGWKRNPVKGKKAYDAIIYNPERALMKLQRHIPALMDRYFTDGLEDFEKFTKYAKIFSRIGEEAEDKIADYLIGEGWKIAYQGGNGDFIDMIFGCDLIVEKDGELKTVQVKHRQPKYSTGYYDVDWIAIANPEIVIKDQK
jgi:hypothetical protein